MNELQQGEELLNQVITIAEQTTDVNALKAMISVFQERVNELEKL